MADLGKKKKWKDIFSVLLWSDIHLLAGYCKAGFYQLDDIVYRSFPPEIKFRTLCEPLTQVVVSARISIVPPWHFSLPIIFSLLFALRKAEHCHCCRQNFAQLSLSGSYNPQSRPGIWCSVRVWIFAGVFEILSSRPPLSFPPHSIQKSTLESGISYFKNIIIITITALATFIIGTPGLLNKNVS